MVVVVVVVVVVARIAPLGRAPWQQRHPWQRHDSQPQQQSQVGTTKPVAFDNDTNIDGFNQAGGRGAVQMQSYPRCFHPSPYHGGGMPHYCRKCLGRTCLEATECGPPKTATTTPPTKPRLRQQTKTAATFAAVRYRFYPHCCYGSLLRMAIRATARMKIRISASNNYRCCWYTTMATCGFCCCCCRTPYGAPPLLQLGN